MARPKEKEPKIQQTVMLKPSVIKEIERIADKAGLTKSQFMGNLIDAALDEALAMERLGILRTIIVGSDIMKKFKKALFSGMVELDKDGNLEIKK
jgi:hypothetical protein